MEILLFSNNLPEVKFDLETLQRVLYERLDRRIDSNYSAVTHFLLCLLAINYPMLKNRIVNVEKEIARDTLLKVDSLKLRQYLSKAVVCLKVALREHNVYGKKLQTLEISLKILEVIEKRVEHILSVNHQETCKRSKLILPFTYPLLLVGQRKVEISLGKAIVYCGAWLDLIIDVSSHLLELKLQLCVDLKNAADVLKKTEDDRIRRLLENCAARLGIQLNSNGLGLTLKSIDTESRYFPPCIAGLHQHLRRTHRLSYDSRYLYSLFLKDAGLNIDENINLWMEEYSKPQVNASCQHDWDEKQTRYVYQLKHMYGLVAGANAKYSPACDRFIDDLSNKMNYGCPFKHLNESDLLLSIPRQLADFSEKVLEFKRADEPRRACAYYLSLQRRSKGPSEIVRPIQFYKLAKRYYKCYATFVSEFECHKFI